MSLAEEKLAAMRSESGKLSSQMEDAKRESAKLVENVASLRQELIKLDTERKKSEEQAAQYVLHINIDSFTILFFSLSTIRIPTTISLSNNRLHSKLTETDEQLMDRTKQSVSPMRILLNTVMTFGCLYLIYHSLNSPLQ